MGSSRVIHYILDCDYKDRNGKYVRHFSATYGGSEKRVTTRMGVLWNNLLQRTTIGSAFQKRKSSYVKVKNNFKDFDEFSLFCEACPGFGFKDENGRHYALDKDILGDGREYSAVVCCFVPLDVNNLLLDKGGKKNLLLPVGVTVRGQKFRVRDGKNGKAYYFENLKDAVKKKNTLKKIRILDSIPKVSYDTRLTEALTLLWESI